MFKKLFTVALISVAFVACNNTTETQEEAVEENNHEHDHGAMTEEASADALYVPANARVYFANLKDGETVSSPFIVQFGIEGMEVRAAGEIIKGTGHHHIIIDDAATDSGTIVPADDTHIHFGGGQTETELTLAPGTHTLTLQFANGIHQSFGPQMSATISVIVK